MTEPTRAQEWADADDTPKEQQQLLTAWEAIAGYVQTCDEEDRPQAVAVLGMIGCLISGGDGDAESPSNPLVNPGAFQQPGASFMQRAAVDTFTCPTCKRTFSTEQGLINHLKQVHSEREKTPYKKNDPNQTQNT